MSNKILGLDLGITSVGWGIIDENFDIIASGVRLFEEASSDNNTKRRSFRSLRRQLRRRKARILRMHKYLEEIGVIEMNFVRLDNPYELRVKGLTNKLSKEELATALLHLAKRRGSSLEVPEDESVKNEQSPKHILKQNKLKSNGRFISEVQIEKLNETGKIRGFDNLYKTSDYLKETKQILSNQGLTKNQELRILEIIEMRRVFSDGPGSISSPSIYGRFRPVDEGLRNEITTYLKQSTHTKYLKETFSITYKGESYRIFKSGTIINKEPLNLINLMKGKCSVYPDEFRAPKLSFSAEIHNFLNDLNNITFGEKQAKLTQNQKEEIIHIIREKAKFSYSDFKKYIGIKDDDLITGFRLLKEKPTLTEFKGYGKILKIYQSFEMSLPVDDILDQIADILTSYPVIENRKVELSKIISDQAITDKLSEISGFTGTHAFSFKALKYLNKELLETNQNQQQIIEASKIRKQNSLENFSLDLDDVTNPVVKRVHKEAFKVYKDLVKEFGVFKRVMIETTRDKNSDEARKRISKSQKKNADRKQETLDFLGEAGISMDQYFNASLSLKMQLYKEQHGKCAYTGMPLDLSTLIKDPQAYQIDHIIPYSISLDDSYNNKVLITSYANQLKGNKTPFGYFHSGKVDSKFELKTYDMFKAMVIGNNSFSIYKKHNLLFEEDITKFSTQKGFISRNLTDTGYIIRSFMNNLKSYHKVSNYETTVLTIRGQQTSVFRGQAYRAFVKNYPNRTDNPLKKNRDVYMHHAIDGLIIAALSEQKLFKQLYQISLTEDSQTPYNINTGEVVELDPFLDSALYKFYQKLANLRSSDIRFSWKIDSKVNRSISDQTIYSTRDVDGTTRVVKRYADIYALETGKLKQIFENPEKSGLLVYRNDKQTYELLKQAYEQYAHEKLPFKIYLENHGPLRKYAKSNFGPEIKTLKYLEDKLGNHIDITSKFSNTKRKIVLLQLSTYRIDIYKSKNGYKFVTVRYHDVRYNVKESKYMINKAWYEEQKNKKMIDNTFEFMFSLYRNSVIEMLKKDKDMLVRSVYRFIATNNDNKNVIEVKSLDIKDSKRMTITIGKNIQELFKYNVSSTGQMQKVHDEKLQLEFK